jgi:hypothetical protein
MLPIAVRPPSGVDQATITIGTVASAEAEISQPTKLTSVTTPTRRDYLITA